MQTVNQRELYFKDPLLEMGYVARFFARSLTSIGYIVLSVAALVLLLSDVGFLSVAGVFVTTLLVWRLWSLTNTSLLVVLGIVLVGAALLFINIWAGMVYALLVSAVGFFWKRVQIGKTGFRGGNLARYITPRARKLVESAYDASAVIGGSFVLHLTKELATTHRVNLALKRLSVDPDEFVNTLGIHLKEEAGLRETNKWRQAKARDVVVGALVSQKGQRQPLNELHLLRGLVGVEHERLQRLMVSFDINGVELEKAISYHIE